MDMEGEKLRYLSERFILIGTKLGCASEHAINIIKENMPIIKEFREQYQPFEHDYEVKYENSVNPNQQNQNVFSNPNATPKQIEDFLVKGTHKLKWTGVDKFNKPKLFRSEIQISFLR